jgi:site-specific recombinase XerD
LTPTSLRVRNLSPHWGLRNVPVKGGKTRDIPLPAAVSQFVNQYVEQSVATEHGPLTPDTPIFWSTWGQRHRGTGTRPMTGDKHLAALQSVRRGLLGHTRTETTQIYAQIQPRQLKQAVNFYEAKALDVVGSFQKFLKHDSVKHQRK